MSIKVTTRVWEHSRQRNSRLLLLLALADFAHDNGVCWAQGLTLATIARKARVNERQGRNLLAQLAAEGELFAPPVAGRGHTNRYFVVVGLDAATIAATMEREFGYDPPTARRIADDVLQRQRAAAGSDDLPANTPPARSPSAGVPLPHARPNPPAYQPAAEEKGQSTTLSAAEQRGNAVPEKRQSGTEKGQPSAEKRQSQAGKGAVWRRPPAARRAAGRPKPRVAAADSFIIRSDPSCDPSPIPEPAQRKQEEEVTATEKLLLSVGLYPSSARNLRDLPTEAVRAYVQRRQRQGWNAGAIKQGLERERDGLGDPGPAPASPAAAIADWQTAALALCPEGSAPEDVSWVAVLLRDGSPPAEAQSLLARRLACRASTPGGVHGIA